MQDNTNTPETAVTITTENFDMLAELSKSTDVKTNSKVQSADATTNAETKTNSLVKTDSSWEADDFTPELLPKKQTETTTTVDAPEDKKAGKQITDKVVESSARTAIGMLDITQRTVLTLVVERKFQKQFTKDEQERIIEKTNADVATLTDADKQLIERYNKLDAKKDRTLKKIPFQPQEETDLAEVFGRYFKEKQIELPVGAHMAFAVINVIGQRVLDVVFD